MPEKYIEFIKTLDKQLEEYFNEQKDYISCSEKCSMCCSNSYYPLSKLEYNYVKAGHEKLDSYKKRIIKEKIINIIKSRKQHKESINSHKDFTYECPFLFNKSCVIYEHRPIICRTHGLIFSNPDNLSAHTLPNCVHKGLNYANVWDEEKQTISQEKTEIIGSENPPKFYKIEYEFLKRQTNLEFGEVHPIYEFLFYDIPNNLDILEKIYFNGKNK